MTELRRLLGLLRKGDGEPSLAPQPGLSRLDDLVAQVATVARGDALLAPSVTRRLITEQLFLGEATIKTYVGDILMKLRCRDRVQAVVAAYEAGLVQPGHNR